MKHISEILPSVVERRKLPAIYVPAAAEYAPYGPGGIEWFYSAARDDVYLMQLAALTEGFCQLCLDAGKSPELQREVIAGVEWLRCPSGARWRIVYPEVEEVP